MVLVVAVSIGIMIARAQVLDSYLMTSRLELHASRRSLEERAQSAVDINRALLSSEEFLNVLRDEESPAGRSGFAAEEQDAVDAVLDTLSVASRNVSSVFVIDFGGRVYSYLVTVGLEYTPRMPTIHELPEHSWYRTVLAKRGREVFFPYPLLQGPDAPVAFSTGKLLRDPVDLRALGFLVINFRSELIRGLFPTAFDRPLGERYFVAGGDDNSVRFFSGITREPDLVTVADGDAAIGSLARPNEVSVHVDHELTGLTLIKLIERERLFTVSWYIVALLVLVVLSISFMDLVFSLFFRRYVSAPLAMLGEVIDQAATGERRLDARFRSDEIGRIGDQFVELINTKIRLEEAIEQSRLHRREAEINVLQSQLRPHFLYNTLDAIYWLAKSGRLDDCAAVTDSLSFVLRRSVANASPTSTLGEEVEVVEVYFSIQKVRFGDRIRLIIDVPTELAAASVPRLLLQPIVENAVYHGLEPKRGGGMIRLVARADEGILSITVADDGIGFTEPPPGHRDALEIVGLTETVDQEHGLGLSSIKSELELLYGNAARVSISSEPERGTEVAIVLPLRREDVS